MGSFSFLFTLFFLRFVRCYERLINSEWWARKVLIMQSFSYRVVLHARSGRADGFWEAPEFQLQSARAFPNSLESAGHCEGPAGHWARQCGANAGPRRETRKTHYMFVNINRLSGASTSHRTQQVPLFWNDLIQWRKVLFYSYQYMYRGY